MINDYTTYRIATADSRKDTNWRNTEITWGELKERCKPLRTHETLAEYLAMDKARRGEIKDIGGFVGGTLKEDGNRKNENLLNRTLLTIDVDNATALPEKPNPRYAMIVHSTHSHTEEAPRYRVIVPLSRPVLPLEYRAIAHKMAEGMGLEQVDITSCEPVRLMYWASAPKDAPVLYHAQDGEELPVDTILGYYKDWKNPDEWPTKERKSGTAYVLDVKKRDTLANKQGNPVEKQNIVGAWCRTYNVYNVLNDMLAGMYVPAGMNRYTYAGGSSFAGVAVYDNGDFFYSYHQSDPLGGRLLNSWDLYRLAVFGHLDKDAATTTRNDRLPSYTAMTEYALKDPDVKTDYLRMTTKANRTETGDPTAPDYQEAIPGQEPDDSWLELIETTDKGITANTLGNIYTILKYDTTLIKGNVKYDEFKHEKIVTRALPWEREETELWTDADTAQLVLAVERKYRIKNKNDLQMIFEAVTREDDFRMNGVRDFINREVWDGKPRVEEVFVNYLGAEPTELNRIITRKAMVACVARAFEPGIKFDQIIVLAGRQGIGKSSLLRRLSGGGKYFMDSFSLDNKNNKMQESVVGSWIIEIPELEGFYKQDMNTIKSFVSKQVDEFRPAYAREKVAAKRTCVFFATTNDEEFLRDSSGNRRFWIIQCGEPPRPWSDLTDYEVAQIWAEAKVLYGQGNTPLYLTRRESEILQNMQKRYDIDNDQVGALEAFLDILLPSDWNTYGMTERRAYFEMRKAGRSFIRGNGMGYEVIGTKRRTEVSAIEVVNEFMMTDNSKGNYQTRIAANLLKKLSGWHPSGRQKTLSGGYGRQKVYVREE